MNDQVKVLKGVCLKQLDIVYYIHSCNTYFANSWYLKKKKKKKKTSFLRSLTIKQFYAQLKIGYI